MKNNKVFGYIGLAAKSGNVASGEFMTEKAVKEGRAEVVIVAGDASDNTKKMFSNMCEYYQVPMYIMSTKDEIGHGIGKQFRASLAITDHGLAKAIRKQLDIDEMQNEDSKER
ncbi:MAG: ribosomal L7Ae/L30e/S12e/Gadd45 family protein [Lachnospiraceae bacterium]|nr:ribosomal L7Ae/L30e/S12e/Gadd45 family protein [Lachnospiraceae bacterium]